MKVSSSHPQDTRELKIEENGSVRSLLTRNIHQVQTSEMLQLSARLDAILAPLGLDVSVM